MYALGAEDLVVGISGYSVHPPRARQEKPKISGFSSAKPERILAVEPDLVLMFSNMQSELCRQLVAEGVEVHAYNQYTISGIFRMIRSLAALIDKRDEGEKLVQELEKQIAAIRAVSAEWQCHPRVYFEEWDAPMISGIGWVSELISIAGGIDVFSDLAARQQAKYRIIEDADELVRRAPDIIIGSWCGKKFRPETLAARSGWDQIPAVKNGMLFEIKSPDILSPGPAAIREGLSQLHRCIAHWHDAQQAS